MNDDVAAEWTPGDVILGLYEVLEEFTGGGRGLVYRVKHLQWDIDLVVKSPRPELFSSEKGKASFEREANLWVNLDLHPRVVFCYYVRRLGGIPRIFAEYVAGGSLADWIRSRKLYESGPDQALARILDLAIQFAWGLGYAHEKGLVHQDVKPANVLLTSDGAVKITDFGVARARDAAAEAIEHAPSRSIAVTTGGMTPHYCSPEQFGRERLTRKTDIWSWGVSILELFTGNVPELGIGVAAPTNLEGYLKKGTKMNLLLPMPEGVARLLQRCFQTNPDDRPANMVEIAGQLKEVYLEVTGFAYPRPEPTAMQLLPDGLNNRALSLLDLGEQTAAEAQWEAALKEDSRHLESTYNLGLSRWRQGKMGDLELCRRLAAIAAARSEEWLPHYLLAQVHVERGDHEAGTKVLQRFIREGQTPEEVRALLAWLEQQQSQQWGRLRTFEGHSEWAYSVCFSPDGHFALSGSGDKTLKLWAVGDGQCLRTFKGHASHVTSVCFSPDGRFALSGSWDNTLRLWEVDTGLCLRSFKGHWYSVTSVCFSPDGRFALSGSEDKTLRLWEIASGRCLRSFEGHASGVTSVVFSSDCHSALSGSQDKTLRLWEMDTARHLHSFAGHTDRVTSVSFSPEGRFALSGSVDKTLRLWILDWELQDNPSADWHEGARPFLEAFLTIQIPCMLALPKDGLPTAKELNRALTRRGKPTWTEAEFQRLLYTLGYAGYGWLRPEGVRRELEGMAKRWKGPRPLRGGFFWRMFAWLLGQI